MTVELLKTIFDWSAVVLVGLTFVAGAGALITGNIIGNRQAAQLRQFDQDLAKAKRENLKLQRELLLMGPRANLLQNGNRQLFIDSLKPFAGQSVEVRRRTFIGSLNGISLGAEKVAEERDGLAEALIGALKDAEWVPPDVPLSSGSPPAQGITVQIRDDASLHTKEATNILIKALSAVPLVAIGPEALSAGSAKRSPGEESIAPPQGADTIVLVALRRNSTGAAF